MMPKYAILGATGNAGRALLNLLSASPEISLNLYARSKYKLQAQNPTLASSPPPNIKFFIGPITNTETIASCIEDVDAVFCVVATNENEPSCHIAQDTAHAVLAALETLRRQKKGEGLPRLIFLSAAPVSNVFKAKMPALVRWLLWKAYGNVYRDLETAEALIRREREWLKVIYVYSGGLSSWDERIQGHRINTEDAGQGFISYGDLAAGMVEIAEAGEIYDWVPVSIVPVSMDVKVVYTKVIGELLKGILWGAAP